MMKESRAHGERIQGFVEIIQCLPRSESFFAAGMLLHNGYSYSAYQAITKLLKWTVGLEGYDIKLSLVTKSRNVQRCGFVFCAARGGEQYDWGYSSFGKFQLISLLYFTDHK